jgi:cytochrome bd-type quinol oxidase subunit 2
MRALCASIITAGALIGLGLASVGLGLRYQGLGMQDPAKVVYVKWVQLDTPMMLVIVVLLSVLIAGLAAAYVGLAYHHERRHHERHHSLASRVGE